MFPSQRRIKRPKRYRARFSPTVEKRLRRTRWENRGAFFHRFSKLVVRVGLVLIALAIMVQAATLTDWPTVYRRAQSFIQTQAESREPYDPWKLAREAYAGLLEVRETSCSLRRATGQEPVAERQRLDTRRLRLIATYDQLADTYETELRNNADGQLPRPADLPPQAPELCRRVL